MQHMEGARYLHRDLKQYYLQLQKKTCSLTKLSCHVIVLHLARAASGKNAQQMHLTGFGRQELVNLLFRMAMDSSKGDICVHL